MIKKKLLIFFIGRKKISAAFFFFFHVKVQSIRFRIICSLIYFDKDNLCTKMNIEEGKKKKNEVRSSLHMIIFSLYSDSPSFAANTHPQHS